MKTKMCMFLVAVFFGLQISRPFLEKGLEAITAPYVVLIVSYLIAFYVVFTILEAHENKKIRKCK